MSTTLLSFIFCFLVLSMSDLSAQTDTRAVAQIQNTSEFQPLSPHDHQLELNSPHCINPGDVITIDGQNLLNLDRYQLVLRAKRQYIPLKKLSMSKQKLIMQIPHDTKLLPGQTYPLNMLIATPTANVSRPTGTSIEICQSSAKFITTKRISNHEAGEILVLTHSGLVDSVIREAFKLGYIDIRQYQLQALNHTLLVLGGSEKHLARTIDKLRQSFPNLLVDYNHLFPMINTEQEEAAVTPHAPNCESMANQSIRIGLLEGSIDFSHEALSGKSLKTKNFILEDEQTSQGFATESAVTLIGSPTQKSQRGSIPFVHLYAANVIKSTSSSTYASAESIAKALNWFLEEQVQIISMPIPNVSQNWISQKVIEKVSQRGLILFSPALTPSKRLAITKSSNQPTVITLSTKQSSKEQSNWIELKDDLNSYYSATPLSIHQSVSLAAIYMSFHPEATHQALLQAINNSYHQTRVGGEIQTSFTDWSILCP